jgi:hypothetical protein
MAITASMRGEILQRQNSDPPATLHSSAEARRGWLNPTATARNHRAMKKIALAALAVLGIVLGTVNFAAPAHAYYSVGGGASQENQGGNN